MSEVSVDWTFRIGGASAPQWGGRARFPAEATFDEKRHVAKLVARQFHETLCRELGVDYESDPK